MTIDTKSAPRRDVSFRSFDDILADLDRISEGLDAGTAVTTGNWTVGEITDHCAKFLRFACDGFEGKAPAPLRFIFRALFFKKAIGPDPLPSGFKLPKQASSLLPREGVDNREGIDELRKQLKRVLAGKEMNQPSPVFGPVTHDQWMIVQTKHCAMHLSFIHPEGLAPA